MSSPAEIVQGYEAVKREESAAVPAMAVGICAISQKSSRTRKYRLTEGSVEAFVEFIDAS